MTGARLEDARYAVVTPPQAIITAEDCSFGAIFHKAGHEEIELAVIIIVKPGGARGPAGRGHARLLRHVRKCAVAVVVIKNAAVVTGDVEINPAIAIVISSSHAHAKNSSRYSGFLGYICEGTVVVVVIQRALQRRLRREKVRRPAVDQIDVHPAVVIVIEERSATAT